MAKFNSPVMEKGKTTNLAGGEAFDQNPEEKLATILLTSFVKDKFYRTATEELEEVERVLDALPDKKFAAQAAIYARTEYGMRSITHALAGLLPKYVSGSDWGRRFYERIVYRPDDMLEIFAFYLAKNGTRKWPMAMKVGFKNKLETIGEYGLAKYRAEGKNISMIDIVNMVHPKANPVLTALMKGELKNTETWEAKLSATGVSSSDEEKLEAKKEVWVEMVRTKKIGHFALLRNLRNISEQAPEVLDEALGLLLDEDRIRKSLVMPFRYWIASLEIRGLAGGTKILDALSKAADLSLANVPEFEGNTAIIVDVSGSMGNAFQPVTRQSQIAPIASAALIAGSFIKKGNADLITFSNSANYQNFPSGTPLFQIVESLNRADRGGTNLGSVFSVMKRKYDRIILLSDMQSWIGKTIVGFDKYTQTYGRPVVFSWDLQGYGTSQLREKDTYLLSGFTDKVFEVMKMLEVDRQALVNRIKAVEI